MEVQKPDNGRKQREQLRNECARSRRTVQEGRSSRTRRGSDSRPRCCKVPRPKSESTYREPTITQWCRRCQTRSPRVRRCKLPQSEAERAEKKKKRNISADQLVVSRADELWYGTGRPVHAQHVEERAEAQHLKERGKGVQLVEAATPWSEHSSN